MSFFIIEGPNGAGKTELIKRIGNELECLSFSSPNGTKLSLELRPIARGVGDWNCLDSFTKFLLFSAARYEEYLNLVHDKAKDDLIVCDRWWTSTFVYQCCEGDVPVSSLECTIHPDEKISGIILLDAKDDVLWERVRSERIKNISHGNCSWTNEKEKLVNIASIYRKEFIPYIVDKKIPLIKIDTTDIDPDNVFNKSVDFMNNERIKNGCCKITHRTIKGS